MKFYLLLYITYLIVISLIKSEPTFEIIEVDNQNTLCDRENGYYQFHIIGEGLGFSGEIRITLPLESPEKCKAVCNVSSTDMFCTIDSFLYDLSGAKILKVFEEEPTFDNLKIINWKDHFKPEHTVLNSGTNCECYERIIPPDEEDVEKEIIFAAYDAKNIEVLGCFREKNNFSFELTKVEDEDTEYSSKDILKEDIYFDIQFKKPTDEKGKCVIDKKNKNGVYTVRCAISYGGEIEVGGEASSIVNIDEKKQKIVFRGLLIPPIKVDEC